MASVETAGMDSNAFCLAFFLLFMTYAILPFAVAYLKITWEVISGTYGLSQEEAEREAWIWGMLDQ